MHKFRLRPEHGRTATLVAHGLAVLATLTVAALAFIGLMYSVHEPPDERVVGLGRRGSLPAVGDSSFAQTMSLLAGIPLLAGNTVSVMTDGDELYPRLWADIRSARRTLTVQMYYCGPGRMATEMKQLLAERAAAGVRVLFLYDAFGASPLPQAYFDSLTRAGVKVAGFRPVKWYQLDKAQDRSHVRVVVVDGRVGYTGGFGLDDKWYGDGHHPDQWRDSNVRFTGPAVLQLQAAFAAGWAEATGELLTGDPFFPRATFDAEPHRVAALMHTEPTIGSTPAERFLALSIAGARHRLYITNSYFIPDQDFRHLLEQAVARGVDVRVLTAGPGTDVKTAWYAGRHLYEELLGAGVRIYEYQPAMMHAKTLVVDGLWSSIGTMNFDNRSLAFNDESNLDALDPAVGATMDSVFLRDLAYASEIKLATFRRRPWTGKLLEAGAALFSRLL